MPIEGSKLKNMKLFVLYQGQQENAMIENQGMENLCSAISSYCQEDFFSLFCISRLGKNDKYVF